MIHFMLEQKYAAANTFNKAGWRNRYTWSRGQSRTIIDFFLCPMHIQKCHYGSEHRCGKWNMHSDHRTIHFRLPEATQPKKERRAPGRKKRGQGPQGVRRASGRNRERHRTIKHAQPRQTLCRHRQHNEGEDAKAKNRTGPKNQRANEEKNSTAEIARRQSKIPTYARNQKIIRADTRNKSMKSSKKRSPDTPTGQRRLTNCG